MGGFILRRIGQTLVVLAIAADVISPHNPLEQNYARLMEGPSAAHWLGTDSFGRDMLSRIIHKASGDPPGCPSPGPRSLW